MTSTARNIINFLNLQVVWFAIILGVAYGIIWPAIIAVAGSLIWQSLPANRNPLDMRAIMVCLLVGFVLDSLWASTGLVSYQMHWPLTSIAPFWIMMLWLAFALTLNHSFSWLHDHTWIAVLAGIVVWPLSYYAGQRLGAIELNQFWLTCSLLSASWVLLVVVLKLTLKPEQDRDPARAMIYENGTA